MKNHTGFNSPYLSYKLWPNSVRVEIGLDYENRGFLGNYSRFKQQNNLHMNNSEPQSSSTAGRSILFGFQQANNIQIPIASELHIAYHTSPRFRPSTII